MDSAPNYYPRYDLTATLLRTGMVLVAGGHDHVDLRYFPSELYNPLTKKFTVTGWMKNHRSDHMATLLPNGVALVAGGLGGEGQYEKKLLASAEFYSQISGLWTTTGPMAYPHLGHTATLLANGKVLVAGGTTGIGPTNIAELFNPATGTWTATVPMAYARGYHTATLLGNGRVLVAGGVVDEGVPCELYYPDPKHIAPIQLLLLND
jgi:hypothetical protein